MKAVRRSDATTIWAAEFDRKWVFALTHARVRDAVRFHPILGFQLYWDFRHASLLTRYHFWSQDPSTFISEFRRTCKVLDIDGVKLWAGEFEPSLDQGIHYLGWLRQVGYLKKAVKTEAPKKEIAQQVAPNVWTLTPFEVPVALPNWDTIFTDRFADR